MHDMAMALLFSAKARSLLATRQLERSGVSVCSSEPRRAHAAGCSALTRSGGNGPEPASRKKHARIDGA